MDPNTENQLENDDFAAAFDQLAQELMPPAAEPAPAAAEAAPAVVDSAAESAPAAAEPAAAAAESAPAAAEPAAAAAESAPAAAEPAAAAAEPAAPSELEQLRAELAELKAQVKAPAAAEPAPAAKPAEPAPLYSSAEQEALAAYENEWPDVAKGEALKRRGEYQRLVSHIFSEVQRVYGPAVEYYQSRSERDQYTDLKAAISDYDEVRDKTIEWANQQPSYLKAAYTKVIEEGTPEEVADLVDRFKKETGYVSAPAATTAKPAPAGGMAAPANSKTELPAAAKQAAKALRVVDTKRAEQTSLDDPNDFDGAFKQFAAAK